MERNKLSARWGKRFVQGWQQKQNKDAIKEMQKALACDIDDEALDWTLQEQERGGPHEQFHQQE